MPRFVCVSVENVCLETVRPNTNVPAMCETRLVRAENV